MNISQLIERLEEARDKYGDLVVCCPDDSGRMSGIEFAETCGNCDSDHKYFGIF